MYKLKNKEFEDVVIRSIWSENNRQTVIDLNLLAIQLKGPLGEIVDVDDLVAICTRKNIKVKDTPTKKLILDKDIIKLKGVLDLTIITEITNYITYDNKIVDKIKNLTLDRSDLNGYLLQGFLLQDIKKIIPNKGYFYNAEDDLRKVCDQNRYKNKLLYYTNKDKHTCITAQGLSFYLNKSEQISNKYNTDLLDRYWSELTKDNKE